MELQDYLRTGNLLKRALRVADTRKELTDEENAEWLATPTDEICSLCGREALQTWEALNGRCDPCRVKWLAIAERESREAEVRGIGIPSRYESFTLDTWRGKVPSAIADWISDGGCDICSIYGLPATGKTHLATAALLELSDKHPSVWVQWIDAAEAAERIKVEMIARERRTLDRLERCGALVLDDLAAERPTEFVTSTLEGILRHRYNHHLGTLITTNRPMSAWMELNPSLARRIFEGGAVQL